MCNLATITIYPMMAMGIVATGFFIHSHSEYNLGVSFAMAVLPGSAIGFLLGIGLLTVVLSVLEKANRKQKDRP